MNVDQYKATIGPSRVIKHQDRRRTRTCLIVILGWDLGSGIKRKGQKEPMYSVLVIETNTIDNNDLKLWKMSATVKIVATIDLNYSVQQSERTKPGLLLLWTSLHAPQLSVRSH